MSKRFVKWVSITVIISSDNILLRSIHFERIIQISHSHWPFMQKFEDLKFSHSSLFHPSITFHLSYRVQDHKCLQAETLQNCVLQCPFVGFIAVETRKTQSSWRAWRQRDGTGRLFTLEQLGRTLDVICWHIVWPTLLKVFWGLRKCSQGWITMHDQAYLLWWAQRKIHIGNLWLI